MDGDHLLGQGGVGLRPPGEGVVCGDGFAVAGGLGQADVPGDHRGVYLTGEVALHLRRHLEGQVGAAVEHGQQHALQSQLGVHLPLYQPDGGQQIAESLQGVILTLHRHQQRTGGAQGVHREHLQGGGAVDEDVVIPGGEDVQGLLQQGLPVVDADHLHPRTGQGLVRGEHVPIFGGHHRPLHIRAVDEHVVDVGGRAVFIHAQAGGGVGLGVEIAQQHPFSLGAEGGCQVDGGGGFAHAALLVDHCDDSGHVLPPKFGKGLTLYKYRKQQAFT